MTIYHYYCKHNLYCFTLSEATVSYEGCNSNPFVMSQGVKQGSLLSPYLYNIYTELLLDCLKELNVGSVLPDGTDTSVIAFVDDLFLMSSSLRGLQLLADRYVKFGNDHNLKINHSKTQFVVSGKPIVPNPIIILDGEFVQSQSSMKHLGFLWRHNNQKLVLHQHVEYQLSEM